MRILLISSYWPEYSGPAVRLRKLNSFFDKDIFVISAKRKRRGISFRINKLDNHREFVLEYRFFYIFDFISSFILFLFLIPFKSTIHTAGSAPHIHAIFFLSNIRKDFKLIIELVNSDSSPIINFKRIGFSIKPRKNSVVILALNSSQKTFYFKTILKPNPISKEVLSIKPKYCINDYPISNKILLGYLSKFKFRKNQIFLIEVMKYLPARYCLLLCGPTDKCLDENGFSNESYLNEILLKIKEYELEERVKVEKGFINASKFYERIDHYLIPSFNEGFGTSIVEAIASGLPVNCNKDEKSFYDCANLCPNTVKCSDIKKPEIFAKNIIQLSGKVKREQLENSRIRIIDYCSEEKIFNIYKEVFNNKTNNS